MKNNRINEALLREYVRSILLETEFAGSVESTGLPSWGLSRNDLVKAFITPFTDVANTAIGKGKEIIRRGRTLVRVAFEAVVSSILPGVEAEYGKIFEREKQDIESIRSEYKEIYDSTEKAFGKAKTLAFFAAPGALLPYFARGSAKKSVGILNAASGGLVGELLEKLESASGGLLGKKSRGGPSSFFERREFLGGRLYEDKEKGIEEKLKYLLENPKTRQRILDAIEKNTAPIKEKLLAAKLKKLEDSFELAKNLISAKNIDQLKKNIKDNSAKADLSKATKEIEKVAGPEEVKKLMGKLPDGTMDFVKNIIVAPLKKEYEELKSNKAPEKLVKQYETVIQKINSL